MATRSFPIQILRPELNNILERTATNIATIKDAPAQTVKDILVQVGTSNRIKMDSTRYPFDVMDRVMQAWNDIKGVASLLLIPHGDSEIALSSQDAVDLSILEAFNSCVEMHGDSNGKSRTL